jgi:diacylglycerol kinase (ATP)
LIATWRDEQAFRQEVIIGIILFPLAAIIPVDLSLRLILIMSMFLVLIVELVNSAAEALTDLITEEFHELAKKAKDCASAAVFVALICSAAMWTIVLYSWYSNVDTGAL